MKKQLAVCAAIGAVAVVPWLLRWSQLPDDVATHWDLYGDANGHLSRGAAFLVLGIVGALLAVAALIRRRDAASPVLAFVATVIAFASLGTVLANDGEARWQGAQLSIAWVVVGLVAGVGAASLFAHVVKHAPAAVGRATRPTMAVGAKELLAWSGTGHSGSLWFFVVFLSIGGVLLYVSTSPGGIVLLLVSALVAELTAVRVVVGAHGVRITPRFRVPWMTISLDRIESAEAIDVRPMAWGGWGYRGSLHLMQRAALVLRAGPGLKLNLHNGSVFVVTVDGAEQAAAVVNGLLARRANSTPR